jgi:hypothetical protein
MTRGRKATGINKGMLAGCVVFAVLTLMVLAYAVGAVVPSVGDALAMEWSGVGYLFGYLFGAGVLGLIALLLLAAALDRGSVPPPAAELPVRTPIHPPLALPDGPGLAARWSAAVPVMLLAAFGPPAVAIVLAAASRQALGELAASVDARPAPEFGTELREVASTAWPVAILPAVVTAAFLRWRNRMTSWPTASTLVAGATLVITSSSAVSPRADLGAVPNVAVSAAVCCVGYALGRLAEHVLSRPVATDLVTSRLEIPFRLPGQLPRLRMRDDGLLLDRLRPWGGRVAPSRAALAWQEIAAATVETRESDVRWAPARGTRQVRVRPGPAVRIEAGERTWLLPARSEQVARTIVTVIALRGHR